MTHVFALGDLLGHPGCGPLADHGLRGDPRGVRGRASTAAGSRRSPTDGPVRTEKEAYPHAFVLLAAASAAMAGRAPAPALLDEVVGVVERAVLVRGRGRLPRELGPRLERARGLPRREREHAHGRGVPGRRRRHRRRALVRARAADRRAADPRRRERPRLADRRALRRAVAAAARLQRRPAAPPVPALRRDAGPRPRVVAAAAPDPRGPRRAARLAGRRGARAVRPRGGRRLGRARRLRLHDRPRTGAPVVADRLHWPVTEAIGAAAALHATTGDDGVRALVPHVLGLRGRAPDRPRARQLARRARRLAAAERADLERQARRLPRAPGHPHPASAGAGPASPARCGTGRSPERPASQRAKERLPMASPGHDAAPAPPPRPPSGARSSRSRRPAAASRSSPRTTASRWSTCSTGSGCRALPRSSGRSSPTSSTPSGATPAPCCSIPTSRCPTSSTATSLARDVGLIVRIEADGHEEQDGLRRSQMITGLGAAGRPRTGRHGGEGHGLPARGSRGSRRLHRPDGARRRSRTAARADLLCVIELMTYRFDDETPEAVRRPQGGPRRRRRGAAAGVRLQGAQARVPRQRERLPPDHGRARGARGRCSRRASTTRRSATSCATPWTAAPTASSPGRSLWKEAVGQPPRRASPLPRRRRAPAHGGDARRSSDPCARTLRAEPDATVAS